MKHRVYEAIVKAIRTGILAEPFTVRDFQLSCLGLGDGTYNAFLYKHVAGNTKGNSELSEKVGPGQFRCLRPFKYPLYGVCNERSDGPPNRKRRKGRPMPEVWVPGSCGKKISQNW